MKVAILLLPDFISLSKRVIACLYYMVIRVLKWPIRGPVPCLLILTLEEKSSRTKKGEVVKMITLEPHCQSEPFVCCFICKAILYWPG